MGLVAHALAADVQVPRNWQEAMQSQQADQWRNAADTEYMSLMEHGTWELVPFPPCEEADWKSLGIQNKIRRVGLHRAIQGAICWAMLHASLWRGLQPNLLPSRSMGVRLHYNNSGSAIRHGHSPNGLRNGI